MKKQYCIDGYLYKAEENCGYLQQALHHATELGVRHSGMVDAMLHDAESLFFHPRYLFIFPSGLQEQSYYATISDKKDTWWQPGMVEMKATEFMKLEVLDGKY